MKTKAKIIIILSIVILAACGKKESPRTGAATAKTDKTTRSKVITDTVLNLASKKLTTLPANFTEYKNVRVLNLSDNPDLDFVTALESIRQMKNLEQLILKDNMLSNVPEEIGFLKNLKKLDLSANEIKRLPPNFRELKNLEYINLSFNLLDTLPVVLTKMTGLKNIEASDNYIKYLPDDIVTLPVLNKLLLSKNELTVLPKNIGKLQNLTWLDLSRNLIHSLPESMGDMLQLSYLDLSYNELEELPVTFRKLNSGALQLYLEKNLFSDEDKEKIKKSLSGIYIKF